MIPLHYEQDKDREEAYLKEKWNKLDPDLLR